MAKGSSRVDPAARRFTGHGRWLNLTASALMLDPVALHQTRFNTPGVVPDGRGVLLGKLGALLFPSVDALVGFFRVFGEEASLDEILPKLRIEEVRGQAGGRQFLV